MVPGWLAGRGWSQSLSDSHDSAPGAVEIRGQRPGSWTFGEFTCGALWARTKCHHSENSLRKPNEHHWTSINHHQFSRKSDEIGVNHSKLGGFDWRYHIRRLELTNCHKKMAMHTVWQCKSYNWFFCKKAIFRRWCGTNPEWIFKGYGWILRYM